MKINGSNGHQGLSLKTHANGVLGNAFRVWRTLQHGQEELIRFGRYIEDPEIGPRLRKQNGHEHCCSVGFLADYYLIKMRPWVTLDELLTGKCFRIHDIPEGILLVDVAAHLKTDNDDLREYLAFEELMKPLGPEIWADQQRAFLLQFCVKCPNCFPEDAQAVMLELHETKLFEALFFDGLQRFDYLHYAYESATERDTPIVLEQVARNQVPELDRVAAALPGFGSVIWTPETSRFFKEFVRDRAVLATA